MQLNEISKQIHKLENDLLDAFEKEWIDYIVDYTITKIKDMVIEESVLDSYSTFYNKCVDDVAFYYPVHNVAMKEANYAKSSWSGGISATNMIEYHKRNVAVIFTCKENMPFGMWRKIYDNIVEKRQKSDNSDSKETS